MSIFVRVEVDGITYEFVPRETTSGTGEDRTNGEETTITETANTESTPTFTSEPTALTETVV